MTLKGAVIGCGFFAANQLEAWREVEGAAIVALCDRDPGRLRAAGERFGIARRHADAGDLIRAGGLDFVDIATTAPSHRPLVEMAASAGLPAICQKPVAPSLADARAMVAACGRAGVPFMVHENFRWQSPIRRIGELIEAGAVGRPFFGRVSFRSGFDVYSGQPYLAEGERFIVEDLGIHILDVARFLLGDVLTLSALTARVNPRIRGEDAATMLLGHESGATSVVDCSYATVLEREPFPETLIEIDGDRGSLRLGADYRLTVATREGARTHDLSPPVPSWGARPWHVIQESVVLIQRHFVDCLRNGREPETSGADNLRTFALVEASYRSAARGGETLRLPEGAA